MWIRFQLDIHRSNYVEEKILLTIIFGFVLTAFAVCFLRDTKGRRFRIVSAKYRETSTAQNDSKMCKQCSELTEMYRNEEIHPRYHVCYNNDKNNSKSKTRLYAYI